MHVDNHMVHHFDCEARKVQVLQISQCLSCCISVCVWGVGISDFCGYKKSQENVDIYKQTRFK